MSLGDASGHLRSVLQDIQSAAGSKKVRDAMCDAFNVDPKDTIGLHVAYSKMLSLVDNIEEDLSHVENNQLFMDICKSLRNAIVIDNLEVQAHTYVQRFAPHLLEKLLFVSDIIKRNKSIKEINADELESLLDDVRSVEHEVLDSNIDDGLKKFIVQKLSEIQQAILGYKISGVDGLQEVLEKCMGAVVVRGASKVDHLGDNERKMIGRLFDILGKISMLVSLSENGTKLVNSALHIFLGQSPQS